MSDEPEAGFDPHAAVSNLTATAALRQPAFRGPQGTEAEPDGGPGAAAPGSGGPMGMASGLEEGQAPAVIDIGVASFEEGDGSAVAVIGSDDREQVTQTEQYPWRAIASLRITARDGSLWIGTGWFISPRTLVTAGHCVFITGTNPNRTGWVSSIDVMPGRNGFLKPLGTLTSKTFWSVRGWTEKGDQNQDYGAIILDQPFGVHTGWFGYGVFDDSKLVGVQAHVAGYPGDKPSGTLWHHTLPIASVGPPKVFYAIDTAGGQSGAAVYLLENNLPVAVAVHAYGGAVSNSGTRINSAVYQNLRQWTV